MSNDDHQRLAQIARNEKLLEALQSIRQWCEAYPITVFTPLSKEQLGEAAIVLGEHNIAIDALHAEWARHLLDGIGKIAREALDETALDETAEDGTASG